MQRFLVVLACGLMAACPAIADTYQLDDGTAEDSVGLTGGGTIGWLNQFAVAGGNNQIVSVNVCFGTPAFAGQNGLVPGMPYNVYVWSDPNQDGNPADATILGTAAAATLPGNIDTNVFLNVPVAANIPGGNGTKFFVGVVMTHPANSFPAPLDENSALQVRSWAAGGAGIVGGNLAGAAFLGTIDSFGLPGNWLVRANAVPEPASLALVALGGLLLARRR